MNFKNKIKLNVILAFLYSSFGFYFLYFDNDIITEFIKSNCLFI